MSDDPIPPGAVFLDSPGVARSDDDPRYRAMVERLFQVARGGTKLSLEPVERALARLGHPERSFSSVHIAGSNGKGSTAAFLAAILAEHGRSVGLYTSPHLSSYTERFRFLGPSGASEIGQSELLAAVGDVEAAVPGFSGLSFFEVTTLAAFLAFRARRIDVAVIEAGLGARLDATRVVDASVAVLTDLSLEHTQILGETLAEIAREEGAVVRSGRPLVAADAPPEARREVTRLAGEASAPLLWLGDAFHAEVQDDGRADLRLTTSSILDHDPRVLEGVELALAGPHQARNAALAAQAAILFEPSIADGTLRAGLRSATWPGRLERRIHDGVHVLLDGAQNAHAARALAAALARGGLGVPLPFHGVFGAMCDKDIGAMLSALRPHLASLCVTRTPSPRSADPSHLVRYAPDAEVEPDLRRAFVRGLEAARASGGTVLVAGSLYLVGEVRGGLEPPNLSVFSGG